MQQRASDKETGNPIACFFLLLLHLLLLLPESVHSAAASRGQMAAYKCLVAAAENLFCLCGRVAPYFGKACSGCQNLLQCLLSSRLMQPTRQPDAARVSRIKTKLRFSSLLLSLLGKWK